MDSTIMLIEIKKGLQNKTDNNNKLICNFLEMLLNSFTIDFTQEHVKCKNQYHRFQYTEDGINNNTSKVITEKLLTQYYQHQPHKIM